jgi:hypothetical protein
MIVLARTRTVTNSGFVVYAWVVRTYSWTYQCALPKCQCLVILTIDHGG